MSTRSEQHEPERTPESEHRHGSEHRREHELAHESTGTAELANEFDAARRHLRAVAYRMLGSLDEAEDAVQETWLRASRAESSAIANVPGWLTTIASRVCLDMLRTRRRRREESADLGVLATTLPDTRASDPETEAVLADEVGLALLVVLDRLGPSERVAFVLHDLFGVPFDEIAGIVDRTAPTTKKLASRARHRVQGTAPIGSARVTRTRDASSRGEPGEGEEEGFAEDDSDSSDARERDAVAEADLARQRQVVAAFLAASRAGDLEALVAVLDPDVVRRADAAALRAKPGAPAAEVRGARRIAEEALTNTGLSRFARAAILDGRPGVLVAPRGRLLIVLALEITGDRVTAIDVIRDPARLQAMSIALSEPLAPVPAAGVVRETE